MTDELEDLDTFRERARRFVRTELAPEAPGALAGLLRSDRNDEDELAAIAHERELQRRFHDAGLAGVCVPTEYGGLGLTPAHQHVLNEELRGYEYPVRTQSPTMAPCLSVLLEFGTEEQKRRHVPLILRGEELWVQFLSEPGSGSDVAGAQTTATRDGDEWILNGSKVWTTGAWWSDWALCLARTNWDVPKHRGLTVFMVPMDAPGIEIHRIELLSGSREFCQEFLTDVRVPDSDRIGEVDDGWTVGTRWMVHERMAFNSPLVTLPVGTTRGGGSIPLGSAALQSGRSTDPAVRELLGEARMLERVTAALDRRLATGIMTGALSDQSAAIGRLMHALTSLRRITITFEIAGAAGAAWTDEDGVLADVGTDFVMRQAAAIGGGTSEMARNVISERVLGMPRERSLDRDVAFRDVPRSAPSG